MSMSRRIGILASLALGALAAGCSHDVRIGAIISQSGAVKPYGEKVKKGLDLALEEINTKGGLQSGGKVILIYKDDATIPERGRQVAEELIEQDGVRLIIGAVSSPVTLAIAPLCEEKRVLLFSPSASAAQISQAGEYVYRNYPSDIGEGTSMARFAKDLGLERMVVFSLDNDYGRGLAGIFTQQYESRFREVVETFTFEEGQAGSIPDMEARLRKLRPDGVYIVAYQRDLAELLKRIKQAGINAVIMGTSAVTMDVVRMAGDAAENLVYPQTTFDLDSPKPAVAAFVRAYREKYHEAPDIYAAHGYDALKILVTAINKMGSAHPDDVRIGLNGINNYEGAAGRTAFDKNGDVIRHPRILLIRHGQAVPYDRFVEQGGSLLAGI